MEQRSHSLLRRLKRIAEGAENGLLVLLLGAMVLLATTQILLRNLWDTGLTWADPALRVAVLWIALLGALAASRDDNHIRIDLLTRFLPERLKTHIKLVTDLFSAVVCTWLAFHSARFVYSEWQDGGVVFAAVPAWVCELIIPIGFASMALRFLLAGLLRQRTHPST